MERDAQFLEYVVKSLVDSPDGVKIKRTVDEMGVLLTLEVVPMDMGKVIGKEGNTAKSIRALLRIVGMKNNSRVNLKINEPEGGLKSAGAMASAAPAASSVSSASKSVDEAMADLNL